MEKNFSANEGSVDNNEQVIDLEPGIDRNSNIRIIGPGNPTAGKSELKGEKILSFIFFLFVNPTSGGNRAAELTKMETERMKFFAKNPKEPESKTKYELELCIYDLKNSDQKDQGFATLKEEQIRGKSNIRVIIGGGDGTVLWVVGEMIKLNIDFEKCPIGILPFGTGNDFSRCLGWGGITPKVLIGKNLEAIKKLMWKWIDAVTEYFDIWDIKIETHEDGCFRFIKKEGSKSEKLTLYEKDEKTQKDQPKHVFRKMMSNYFSIGIDGRIGLGFDRNRSDSGFKNKVVYAWEGFKKMFLKTTKMNGVIDTIEHFPEEEIELSNVNINVENLGEKAEVLVKTRTLEAPKSRKNSEVSKPSKSGEDDRKNIKVEDEKIWQDKKDSAPFIKGNPANILCININSYSGGSDVWARSQGKLGIEASKGNVKDFGNQKIGDGKLEFVTFESGTKIGLERIIPGQAKRVAQGSGPFIVRFKSTDTNGQSIRTYFQIDGEFYQVISPKSVKIRLCKDLPKGKIKVLMESSSRNKQK